MLLDQIQKSKWYKKPAKRKWRWNWSWKWNYCTRWLKGQKSRSGWAKPIWFEWGQMPLIRRIPKAKWFKRYYKLVKNYQIVNLDKLSWLEDWTVVNKEFLYEKWLIEDKNWLVKVLARWQLKSKLNFEWIDSFSGKAKELIEKTGGTIK